MSHTFSQNQESRTTLYIPGLQRAFTTDIDRIFELFNSFGPVVTVMSLAAKDNVYVEYENEVVCRDAITKAKSYLETELGYDQNIDFAKRNGIVLTGRDLRGEGVSYYKGTDKSQYDPTCFQNGVLIQPQQPKNPLNAHNNSRMKNQGVTNYPNRNHDNSDNDCIFEITNSPTFMNVTPEFYFYLCGLWGDIRKVKISYNKNSKVFIEAMSHLDKLWIMTKLTTLQFSVGEPLTTTDSLIRQSLDVGTRGPPNPDIAVDFMAPLRSRPFHEHHRYKGCEQKLSKNTPAANNKLFFYGTSHSYTVDDVKAAVIFVLSQNNRPPASDIDSYVYGRRTCRMNGEGSQFPVTNYICDKGAFYVAEEDVAVKEISSNHIGKSFEVELPNLDLAVLTVVRLNFQNLAETEGRGVSVTFAKSSADHSKESLQPIQNAAYPRRGAFAGPRGGMRGGYRDWAPSDRYSGRPHYDEYDRDHRSWSSERRMYSRYDDYPPDPRPRGGDMYRGYNDYGNRGGYDAYGDGYGPSEYDNYDNYPPHYNSYGGGAPPSRNSRPNMYSHDSQGPYRGHPRDNYNAGGYNQGPYPPNPPRDDPYNSYPSHSDSQPPYDGHGSAHPSYDDYPSHGSHSNLSHGNHSSHSNSHPNHSYDSHKDNPDPYYDSAPKPNYPSQYSGSSSYYPDHGSQNLRNDPSHHSAADLPNIPSGSTNEYPSDYPPADYRGDYSNRGYYEAPNYNPAE